MVARQVLLIVLLGLVQVHGFVIDPVSHWLWDTLVRPQLAELSAPSQERPFPVRSKPYPVFELSSHGMIELTKLRGWPMNASLSVRT